MEKRAKDYPFKWLEAGMHGLGYFGAVLPVCKLRLFRVTKDNLIASLSECFMRVSFALAVCHVRIFNDMTMFLRREK